MGWVGWGMQGRNQVWEASQARVYLRALGVAESNTRQGSCPHAPWSQAVSFMSLLPP